MIVIQIEFYSPELYRLLLRNFSPYLPSAKGIGISNTATNPKRDVAQPVPNASSRRFVSISTFLVMHSGLTHLCREQRKRKRAQIPDKGAG